MTKQELREELVTLAARLVDAGVSTDDATAALAAGEPYAAVMAAATNIGENWVEAVVDRFRHLA